MIAQAMRRVAAQPTLRIALVGLCAALFVVAALLLHGFSPSSRILGGGLDAPHFGPFVDWNIHYWNCWQTSQVITGKAPLFHSVLEFFPHGMSIGNVRGDPGMRLLGGLLNLVFSPDTAFSLVGFLVLWGNAMGGYLLGFQLTKRHLPGVMLGVVLTLCGMVAWALGTGNPEYGFLGWICLHLVFLHRIFESGGGRNAILCAVFGALSVWTNLGVAFHLLLMDLFLVTFGWREVLARWKPLILCVVMGSVLLAPAVVANLAVVRAEAAASEESDLPLQRGGIMIVPLENSRSFSQYLPWTPKDDWTADTRIPYGILLLGLVGFLLARKRIRQWSWMALLFFILTLGPYLVLQIGGGEVYSVQLPYYFLHKYLPFYDQFRFPNRVIAFCLLALGAAAAIGLGQVVDRLRGRVIRWIPVVIVLLVTAEMFATWQVSSSERLPPSSVMEALRDDPGGGAVVALPMDFGALDSAHLRNQTSHGRPLMNGVFPHYLGKANPVQDMIAGNPLLRRIWSLQAPLLTEEIGPAGEFLPKLAQESSDHLDPATVAAARADLRGIGFGFVLYHRILPTFPGHDDVPDAPGELERYLDEILGSPIAHDEVARLYRI